MAVRPYRQLSQHSSAVLNLWQELDLEALSSSPGSSIPLICCSDSTAPAPSLLAQPCMVAGDEAAVRKLQELWSEKSLLERYGEVRFSVRMKPFAWGPFEVDGLLQLKYFLRMIHTHSKVDWP